MNFLARLVAKRSGTILITVFVLSVVAGLSLPLDYDDDVIRFLPVDDPEVSRLNTISERFGSVHIALLGIESENLFEAPVLAYARAVSNRLKKVKEVANVTSMTELNIADATQEDGESTTILRALIPDPIPSDPSVLAELKKNVLSYDYLAGSLVSNDGSSALLICQLHQELDGERVSPKKAAEAIRKALSELEAPAHVRLHFGGAPFIAESVANGSQRDLRRLAPYVCAVILLLVFLSLGSVRAAILALSTVGLGILWTMGLMGWLNQSLTLVSSSLPVILVALGSAYAVHLLVWFMDHDDGVDGMLSNVGWPVVVAALTTVAGFISFLLMDIAPMREFGWQMAAGTGICGLVAMLVIPAYLHRWPIPKRENPVVAQKVDSWLVALATQSQRHRTWVLGIAALITVFFAFQLPKIEARMDAHSFFPEGSAPLAADELLTKHFGGSVYLQIMVSGDIKEPAVMRQLAAFEDRLSQVEGVTRIQSITKVLALVTEAQTGKRELPRKRGVIEQLGKLAHDSDPAVGLLIDASWRTALIQVGIGGFDTRIVRRVTNRIRDLMKTHLPNSVSMLPRSKTLAAHVIRDAAERIAIVAGRSQAEIPKIEALLLSSGANKQQGFADEIAEILVREIEEEEMVELREGSDLKTLAAAIEKDVQSSTFDEAGFVQRLIGVAHADELNDLVGFQKGVRLIFRMLHDLIAPRQRAVVMKPIEALLGRQTPTVLRRVGNIVDDVLANSWMVASEHAPPEARKIPIETHVSGYPIVQEAMARSVHKNQTVSLLTSLPLVLIILCIVFRSFRAGFIALVPTGFTLMVTFGLMGLYSDSLPLDIGGSMLASIALGVGIDYAIHFLWRYRETGVKDAMHTTGRSIVINAAEITAGFAVLMWASIAPMSRFGLLIAETLLVAALTTLILLPAMLSWWKPATLTDSKED
ncbi:MAG TPA: hypothetical protein EYN06_03505 [Myxococcales bacterium]|nr:hypothetical protein [Myxococcales bacterium]